VYVYISEAAEQGKFFRDDAVETAKTIAKVKQAVQNAMMTDITV